MVVVQLMMDLGDDRAAEAALVAAPNRISGWDYGTLLPLVAELERRDRSCLCAGLFTRGAVLSQAARTRPDDCDLLINRDGRIVRDKDSAAAPAQGELLGVCQWTAIERN